MLPPGRLRLVTSPSWTGSVAVAKTMGIVLVAAWAASTAAMLPGAAITAICRRTQIGGQCGQLFDLILCPTVFDGHVLTLGMAGLLQALPKCLQKLWDQVGRPGVEEPDHRYPRRLRVRGERARDAHDQCDELTPSHTTSSDPRRWRPEWI